MTELHPEAVVCLGCGASKLHVRKKAGFLRGLGILGFSELGMLLVMAGHYKMGFGLIGIAVLLGYALPYETKWVKSI